MKVIQTEMPMDYMMLKMPTGETVNESVSRGEVFKLNIWDKVVGRGRRRKLLNEILLYL
jgi:hypothetical protein